MWKFSREKKGFEIAKVNSRCFAGFRPPSWCPSDGAPTWRPILNSVIFRGTFSRITRTALWLSHVDYVSLLYNISISWLYLLNGWGLYFFTCVTMCEVKTTNTDLCFYLSQHLSITWIITDMSKFPCIIAWNLAVTQFPVKGWKIRFLLYFNV